MKLHEQYYVEKAKVEKLIAKKNQKSDFIMVFMIVTLIQF